MSMAEKILIIGSLVGIGTVGTYHFFNSNRKYKSRVHTFTKKRDELLDSGKIRLLYSSMSFLYLYKTDKKSEDSLYLLQELLGFAKPKFMAMAMSEKDFKDRYESYIKSPQFVDDMKKLDFLMLTKKGEEIKKYKEGFTLEDWHNMFAFHWCHNRKCNLVFGGISDEEASKLEKAKALMQKTRQEASPQVLNLYAKEKNPTVGDIKAEYFVDKLMERVSPKFSVLPQPLDKTLVGIVPEELEENITDIWKSKFKTVYNHRILEIDEVSVEEEQRIIAEQNKKYD